MYHMYDIIRVWWACYTTNDHYRYVCMYMYYIICGMYHIITSHIRIISYVPYHTNTHIQDSVCFASSFVRYPPPLVQEVKKQRKVVLIYILYIINVCLYDPFCERYKYMYVILRVPEVYQLRDVPLFREVQIMYR